jgi:isopenicillin-N epimerase
VDDLLGAFTQRTRLLFVSHVSSTTALRFPVEELCTRARAAGVCALVDGAHAPSQLDLDLATLGADFYTGNCHKWLCSPKGAGFLHVAPDAQELLEPLAVSWDWAEDDWADRHRWHGTKDPTPYLAVPAAIDFQAERDWPTVRSRCHALAARARRELSDLLGTEPFAAQENEFVQMCSVRLPRGTDAAAVGRRLFDEHRIEVGAKEWRGEPTLRVCFQGYNDETDLEALTEALPRVLR